MRPKLPTNAIAYTILSLAGAGSFFVPGEMLMPTTAAQTIPADASPDTPDRERSTSTPDEAAD